MIEDRQLTWGMVGTSGYAERVCLPAFAETESTSLVAIASSSAERAKAFAGTNGIERAYGDVKALCADPDVAAVWIASGSYLHLDHARSAIDAGKHVLLEKPIALSAVEGWELVHLAEASGVLLATGYQARYVPGHRAMRQLIADGRLGEIVAARSLYGMRRVGAPRGWRSERDKARWGVLADIGTHHIDLLRMLVGEIVAAAGYTAHQRGYETEDLAVATLRFDTGALGTMTITGNYPRPTTVVEVVGTEGSVVATDTSPTGQGTVQFMSADGSVTDITGQRPHSAQAQLQTVTAAFLGADVAYATGADGARNLDILEMISP
jgi:1,5-anhydro-D-fructose reductase (1,5-anhydro-D-mannitol-forming)